MCTYQAAGRGSPLDSEGTEWEKKYFRLIDKLEDHNLGNNAAEKNTCFLCAIRSS
jgi:hypothetical protein